MQLPQSQSRGPVTLLLSINKQTQQPSEKHRAPLEIVPSFCYPLRVLVVSSSSLRPFLPQQRHRAEVNPPNPLPRSPSVCVLPCSVTPARPGPVAACLAGFGSGFPAPRGNSSGHRAAMAPLPLHARCGCVFRLNWVHACRFYPRLCRKRRGSFRIFRSIAPPFSRSRLPWRNNLGSRTEAVALVHLDIYPILFALRCES